MTTLLLIDVQKDFHPGGSLAIPTANEDAERIVQLIRTHSSRIDRVVATLDSHHKLHIAHPCFWWDANEQHHPDPFTIISHDDVVNGKWKPRSKLVISDGDLTCFDVAAAKCNDGTLNLLEYAKEYTKRLEAKGRFQLCIWPEHCLIGSNGHAIVDNVRHALDGWADETGGHVEFVWKGQNLLTEMYSALEADVPVSRQTSFNEDLFESLLKSSALIVCGQAMSHCVNYTMRDIVRHWPEDRRQKITLLIDCASAVPGFEADAESFKNEMRDAGIRLTEAATAF